MTQPDTSAERIDGTPDRIWLLLGAGEQGSHTWCACPDLDGSGHESVEYVKAAALHPKAPAAATVDIERGVRAYGDAEYTAGRTEDNTGVWAARVALLAAIEALANASKPAVDADERPFGGNSPTFGAAFALGVAAQKQMQERASRSAAMEAGGGMEEAARRYMLAVKRLGEQSGYNGLTFFEAPISKMPNDDLGMEAISRWQELNDSGKALTYACDRTALAAQALGRVDVPEELRKLSEAAPKNLAIPSTVSGIRFLLKAGSFVRSLLAHHRPDHGAATEGR